MMHHDNLDKFRDWYYDHAFAVFRVLVGLLFMSHGAQKIFGVFGGSVAQPFGQMWFAGMIELFAGFLITVGLATIIVAALSSLYMLVVFFYAHFSFAEWIPIVNRGELALLYFAAFLFIATHGPGRYSTDAKACGTCKTAHK